MRPPSHLLENQAESRESLIRDAGVQPSGGSKQVPKLACIGLKEARNSFARRSRRSCVIANPPPKWTDRPPHLGPLPGRRDPRIRSPSRAAVIAFRIAGHDSCPRVILTDVAILPARVSGADTPSCRRAIHSARQRRTGSVQSLRVVRMGFTSQRSRAST